MSLCWRCGRVDHADWCSDGTANDCDHCGGNPCRWWCLGEFSDSGLWADGSNLRPSVLEPA